MTEAADSMHKAAVDKAPPRRAGAPKAIQLLLPVWGQDYIKQFLDVCLPTLLAPGNLPALAKLLPCEFVFLTTVGEADVLRRHPGIIYLESICKMQLQIIDDLITGDNYSTTITLAYERAVRAAGPAMLDTCFFFLISDYIIADGSLANVFARVAAGASGVLAGNFQIVEETAASSFYDTFDRGGPAMVLPPRALIGWALNYLHPVTVANTVNVNFCHALHSNRLFWRVDAGTLIGRFYLMHMIAIRPERRDFVIGSSCDYSFIPEMCPSGNVEAITDSDDYLVIEMQPRGHERQYLRLGPQEAPQLARSLSEWTTARHRQNAKAELVYHAADIPASFAAVSKAAAAFVEEIDYYLKPVARPHRNHPYWIGAMTTPQCLPSTNTDTPDKSRETRPPGGHTIRLRQAVFGLAPRVPLWHPRWPDYRIIEKEVLRLSGGSRRQILAVTPMGVPFKGWLKGLVDFSDIETKRLLSLSKTDYMPLLGKFAGCVLLIGVDELQRVPRMLQRIMPLVAPDGFLLVTLRNGRGLAFSQSFEDETLSQLHHLLHLSAPVTAVKFVSAGMLRKGVANSLVRLSHAILREPAWYYPVAVAWAPLLLFQSLVGNWIACRREPTNLRGGLCSSIHVVMRAPAQASSLPDFDAVDLFARADRYRMPENPRTQLTG